MKSNERVVTQAEENALRRQFDEALKHLLLDRAKYEATKEFLQVEVINPHQESRARDLAEERRLEIQGIYLARGFSTPIPKPEVSNREFERRRTNNQELFFRHATAQVGYTAFMTAVDQSEHWTVKDEAERAKIVWEDAEQGYWFWAEVPANCPRLATTWNDLSGSIRLLSLEEYVIVWWMNKSLIGLKLDVPTWCWLRTRYKSDVGLGALSADECDGRVYVGWSVPQDLAVPHGYFGGRASEVVKTAA